MQAFENIHQIGGLRQVELVDGPGRGNRLVEVNTGSLLRYDVALDRGADIVEAFYGSHSLCYLTPNGIKRPNHAYSRGDEWLAGWPGGLLTTCGPVTMGSPREENGRDTGLHGKASNCPAELVRLENPDLHLDRREMTVETVIRDSRAYGPFVEVQRKIQSTLGEAAIRIDDLVINKDACPTAHSMMYHVNFGYPFLDEGARLVLGGKVTLWPEDYMAAVPAQLEDWKDIPGPLEAHRGVSARGFVIEPDADAEGKVHAAIVNEKLGIAVEMIFPLKDFPRMTVWQHFGPGMYVMALEPMAGTPEGAATEPKWALELQSGESRKTSFELKVHEGSDALTRLLSKDTPLSYAAG